MLLFCKPFVRKTKRGRRRAVNLRGVGQLTVKIGYGPEPTKAPWKGVQHGGRQTTTTATMAST